MNTLWNMIMDAIIIGIMVSLVLIVIEFEMPWRIICLALVFVLYGFIHAVITMKRMGYKS